MQFRSNSQTEGPMRSFQSRLFLTLLLVALIPIGLLGLGGTVAVQEVVRAGGTAGPWDAVARSGEELAALARAQGDPDLTASAERHREALSESVRLSRLYAFTAARLLDLLPALALGLIVLAAGLALLAARLLARQFSAPLEELVAWAGRVGRGEPIPEREEESGFGEFARLRSAFREMERELLKARRAEEERIRMRSWTETARRMAHELKNPLGPMKMAATRMADGSGARANGEAAEILLEEIDRLDDLARSLSNFGSPPEGPPAPVDLRELLAGAARTFGPELVTWSTGDGVGEAMTEGHAEALARVFRNLVSNALEASEEMDQNGPPPVVIRLEEGDGEVRIRVRDRGPGIPEEVLHRIWEPDFTTKRRGTGLGLALVRRTVEEHGGRVEARNAPEGGAEFSVHLPALADLRASGTTDSEGEGATG